MNADRPYARSQRLALVFRAAGTRFAVPAAAVLEVAAAPAPGQQAATRAGLPVEDFSLLLGEPACSGPEVMTLVIDCAPPRALLVDGVGEVVDLVTAPFYRLPAGTAARSLSLIRGAVMHADNLVLELIPEALAGLKPVERSGFPPVEEARPQAKPEKALLFQAGGELFGVALPLVTGVLRATGRCYVPLSPPGHSGLVLHERALLPIYDLGRLSGRPATEGELAVVLDVAGSTVGAAASQVFGVVEGFAAEPLPERGGVRWRLKDGRKVFFPDLERWFPSVR